MSIAPPAPTGDGPLTELTRQWNLLSMTKRFVVLAVALAAVGLLALAGVWASRPEYRALFTDLKAEDAAGVTHKLKELKIPYQLTDDGATVSVPAPLVNQARLELASAGLPEKGAMGFELFDRTHLQTSALSERVTYIRALQGELETTIGSLSEVESVRVHLALPTRDVFVDDQKQATASILIKLNPGHHLAPGQIKAITGLVSSSVENLTPEHVTILDTDGNQLTVGDDKSLPSGATTMIDLQHDQEKHIESRAQEILDRLLGPGEGLVRVTLQLDTAQKTSEAKQFVPTDKNAGIVRSTQTVSEGYHGSAAAALAAAPAPAPAASTQPSPAAASPVPMPAAVGEKPTEKSPQYQHEVSTTNYEISQTEEKTVSTPGGIVHMTVAVLLPSRIKLPADGPAQIKSLIEQATGFDESRKDTITVSVLPFNVPDIAAETQEMVKEDRYRRTMDLARVCMPVVAVVLFWGIGGYLARRRQQKRPVDVAWRLDDPASANLVPAGGPTLSSTGATGSEPHGVPVLPPSEDVPTPGVGALPGGITPDARLVALGDLDETARLIELWTQTKTQEGDQAA